MRKKLLFISLFFVMIQVVCAQNVILNAEVPKTVYNSEEIIDIKIDIENPTDQEMDGMLSIYFEVPGDLEFTPTPILEQISIRPNGIFSNKYQRYAIGEGEYIIYIRADFNGFVNNKGIDFKISPGIPEIELFLDVCKDEKCLERPKVFIQNKDIYLNYNSNIDNLDIITTLIDPDKKIYELALPTSIKFDKIGTYTLNITASKEGYKTNNIKVQFGVINENLEIGFETSDKSTPRKVNIFNKIKSEKTIKIIIYILIIFIFVVIFIEIVKEIIDLVKKKGIVNLKTAKKVPKVKPKVN